MGSAANKPDSTSPAAATSDLPWTLRVAGGTAELRFAGDWQSGAEGPVASPEILDRLAAQGAPRRLSVSGAALRTWNNQLAAALFGLQQNARRRGIATEFTDLPPDLARMLAMGGAREEPAEPDARARSLLVAVGEGVLQRLRATVEVCTSIGAVVLAALAAARGRARVRTGDYSALVRAAGADALGIVGDRPTGPDPKGPDSPFHRVLASGGTLIGLGVTTNYMGMTHVIDARFRHRYAFPIYSTQTYPATSCDYDGVVHSVRKHAVLENVERNIKPGRVIDLLPPGSDIFRSIVVEGSCFFRWSLPGWEEVCTRHVEERLRSGREPCWHELVALEHGAKGASPS